MEKGQEQALTEILKFIEKLNTEGHTGFWILVMIFIALVVVGIVALVYQRIVIARFEITAKATDERLKAVDSNIKSVTLATESANTTIKILSVTMDGRKLEIEEE